jgi:hypothetical protein
LKEKRKGLTGNGLVRHPVAFMLPAIQWPLPGRAREGGIAIRHRAKGDLAPGSFTLQYMPTAGRPQGKQSIP